MGYTPLKIKNPFPSISKSTTFMGKGGEDKRDLPQLLNVNYAQKIVNYLIDADGQLTKRKGLENVFEVAGNQPITMLEKFTDDIYIYGYDTTVAAYSFSADASTVIKADFSSNDGFDGTTYGDYFFVCNGKQKIWEMSRVITYGTQTQNFTEGSIVTGGTSGATAVILEDDDSGATGTLTLGNISGTFQNGETITDAEGTPGSATTTSLVTYAITQISEAPQNASVVRSIGARLFAGSDSDVHYSSIDDGTNPPFANWTPVDSAADGPGKVSNRKGGTVRDIQPFGSDIVVFQDEGKYAFFINQIDSAGTLSRVDVFKMSRFDHWK